jgi:hypothetical protein
MLEYPGLFIDIIDAKNALCPMGSTHSVIWDFMHMRGTLDAFHTLPEIQEPVSEGVGESFCYYVWYLIG